MNNFIEFLKHLPSFLSSFIQRRCRIRLHDDVGLARLLPAMAEYELPFMRIYFFCPFFVYDLSLETWDN